MKPYDLVLSKLHGGKNPYDGYPWQQWLGAWYSDPAASRPIFRTAMEKNPQVVIEVGSFVGESAIHMAKLMKELGNDGLIICVDTWYAGFDHYKGAPEKIRGHFGRPDLYYRFMANVIQHQVQDRILPLAMDSINAARVLGWIGIQADFIYVDASHEEGDVLRDYNAYWDLVRSGGAMMVDDLTNHFPGVLKDWAKFIKAKKLTPYLTEGEKAIVIKP
jgi:cephalosporin hydroxylase